jgi:hypothetical protein
VTAKKKKTRENPLRGIARAIDAAGRDAELARGTSTDPAFRRGLQNDRRGTLSKFRSVRQALTDREKIEKAKRQKS